MQESCNQLIAMKFFRVHINGLLERCGAQLQIQPYDHVLRDDERRSAAFQAVVEYIARNPERKGIVPTDKFHNYEFTDCLVPGYPDVKLFQPGFWDLFDRICSRLRHEGLWN